MVQLVDHGTLRRVQFVTGDLGPLVPIFIYGKNESKVWVYKLNKWHAHEKGWFG